MEWDGRNRRYGDKIGADLVREIQALHATTLEMHRENKDAAEDQRKDLDTRLGAIASSLHALEMTMATGDSMLHERIAVHEAAPHHAGTLERLNSHDLRLEGHDVAINKLRQRLGVDDGRREATTEHRERRYVLGGLVIAAIIGVGQIVSQLVGSAWQTVATLISGNGPHAGS